MKLVWLVPLFHRASPIIMLHFVEGLPRKDLQHYAFHFEGSLYQVTSIIQYQANNHFITWILDADGKYWKVLCYWVWEIEPRGFCFVIKTDFTWISFFSVFFIKSSLPFLFLLKMCFRVSFVTLCPPMPDKWNIPVIVHCYPKAHGPHLVHSVCVHREVCGCANMYPPL